MRAFRPWKCLVSLLVLLPSVAHVPAEDSYSRQADGKPSQQTTEQAQAKEPLPNDKRSSSGLNALELLKLPSGAILVLCEQGREGLPPLPRSVLVPLEEFQKLLDQLDQARRAGRP